MKKQMPSLFIGSSSEGLDVAREIELQLEDEALITIWKNGIFSLGEGILESLMNALDQFDFAIMVLTPDDLLESRGHNYASPRDNVLFELGLFMGRLGRSRTFILHEHNAELKLPSDLAGITRATYKSRDNLSDAVSLACTRIIKAVRSLGLFEGRQAAQLSRATIQIEDVSQTVATLIMLLARSRTVELEIMERQFGWAIEPDLMRKIKNDINDFVASLPKNNASD